MKLGGLILAAGMSSRMGYFKPLLLIQGKAMIDWTVDAMRTVGVDKICVVTGYGREELEDHLKRKYGDAVACVWNAGYSNGKMLDSIQRGLQNMKETDAFFLTLADLPAVSTQTYEILKDTMDQTRKNIMIANINGRRRHPQLIAGEMIPSILAFESEEGGLRKFWKNVESEIVDVKVEDMGCDMDADTMSDIKRIASYLQQI